MVSCNEAVCEAIEYHVQNARETVVLCNYYCFIVDYSGMYLIEDSLRGGFA